MLSALAVLVAVGLLAGLAGCGGGPPASAAVAERGCHQGPGGSYPGPRAGDCLSDPRYRFVVVVDGYEALVGNWKRFTDDQGRRLICAGVNVENLAPVPHAVAARQFHLRDPAGRVETAAPAPSNGFPDRTLRTGVQQGGGVCWPDDPRGGRYVASFEPGPGTRRGIWLVSLLAESGNEAPSGG